MSPSKILSTVGKGSPLLNERKLTLWPTKPPRLNALGHVCKFVLWCKNLHRIGPSSVFLTFRCHAVFTEEEKRQVLSDMIWFY